MTAQLAPDRSVTPLEAARLLGVHKDTVIRWANAGKLPSWRTPGNQRRFRLADVEALRSQAA